jgi:hypothetical protein
MILSLPARIVPATLPPLPPLTRLVTVACFTANILAPIKPLCV